MQSLNFKNHGTVWDYHQQRIAKLQQNRAKQQTKNRQNWEAR